jgi:hypothetical protein
MVRCRLGEGMIYFRPGIGYSVVTDAWLLVTGHWLLAARLRHLVAGSHLIEIRFI